MLTDPDDGDWQPVRLTPLAAAIALIVMLGPWTVGVWQCFKWLMR